MMEAQKQEIMTQQNNQVVVTPSTVLSKAYESGASIEHMTQLLELQERFEKREAEKAFNLSLAAFKANPPKILKDRHVSFDTQKGRTEYDHASLANVVYTVSEGLSEHGLSASWETLQDSGLVSVTCILGHELGHEKRTTLSASPDASGGKNNIQAIGSTVSYLQRYTLLSITGLATHDQDNDAASKSSFITFEQAQEIENLLKESGGDIQSFVEYFNVSSISELPADKYKTIITSIKAKAAKKKEAVK